MRKDVCTQMVATDESILVNLFWVIKLSKILLQYCFCNLRHFVVSCVPNGFYFLSLCDCRLQNTVYRNYGGQLPIIFSSYERTFFYLNIFNIGMSIMSIKRNKVTIKHIIQKKWHNYFLKKYIFLVPGDKLNPSGSPVDWRPFSMQLHHFTFL